MKTFNPNAWRDRADIPNQVGFKLVVLVKRYFDDSTYEAKTQVIHKHGIHTLDVVPFGQVCGWKPA